MPSEAWKDIPEETRDRRNEAIQDAAVDVRAGVGGLLAVLNGEAREEDAEEKVKTSLDWARMQTTSEDESRRYVLRSWTDMMHRAFVVGFIVVEDEEALKTGTVLVVFLDERGKSVREVRCDAESVNGYCPLWDEGTQFDGGQWEHSTIGEDYEEGGERWSVTRGEVEHLMPLW
ncbi:hypothetical protein BKA65DRAFT_566453 [Rhexocercosporidium sp. MPI-PUGE-AT-0058]|nr:hypothetical protein BKA65DRAFT_566453 [Rhexocercosporidium sp. MPI-PUGE-AT-0058]